MQVSRMDGGNGKLFELINQFHNKPHTLVRQTISITSFPLTVTQFDIERHDSAYEQGSNEGRQGGLTCIFHTRQPHVARVAPTSDRHRWSHHISPRRNNNHHPSTQ